MRVTVIHNPGAGEGEPSADVLLSTLLAHGYKPLYQSSKKGGWKRALDDPGEMIIVAGGDGTVARVGKRLARLALAGRETVPLAILPLGTANNIANSIGVSGTLDELAEGWRNARRLRFDVGRAARADDQENEDATLFMESIGCGLFADMMADFEKDPKAKRGSPGPDEALRRAREKLRRMLRETSPRQWRVELDGQDYSGRYSMIEVMNTRRIGPAFELAPAAQMGDGLFDVVFTCDDAADRARLDAHLFEHPADDPAAPLLTTRRAQEVVIDTDGDRLHLDDKPWPRDDDRPAGPVRLRLQRHALTFLVP